MANSLDATVTLAPHSAPLDKANGRRRICHEGGIADPEGFEPSRAGLEIRSPIRAGDGSRRGHGTPMLITHRPAHSGTVTLATSQRSSEPGTPPRLYADPTAFTPDLATSRT